MFHLVDVISPRAILGNDLPGAAAAHLWDSTHKRSIYACVFTAAGRGMILNPATGHRRWYRDVYTLPELIEAANNRRMVKRGMML